MGKRIKNRLLIWLIRDHYYGITEEDFVDTRKIRDEFFDNYALRAQDVVKNDTFKNELKKMQYQQERYLVQKAKTAEDLIFGRAALYVIDMIQKRFQDLSDHAETISELDEPQSEATNTEY